MLVLGVDTSTEFLSVALINGKKVLANYDAVGKLNHSALLVPTIKKAFAKAGKKIRDVALFSVGIGPGSFTGLRVGVTAIRGLAIALDKPLIGIPTMDAIAYNGYQALRPGPILCQYTVKGPAPLICPILDAKKSQVYACIYRVSGDKIVKKSGYLLESVDALIRRLNPLGMVRENGKRSRTNGRILFLGDGVPLYKDRLLSGQGMNAEFIEDKRWFPKASVIAEMGLKKFQKGKGDNPYDLEPMYLYAKDCNVRKA